MKSDGSVWFTDPDYGIKCDYEGARADSEIGACNVYRIDPATGAATIVADDFDHPNGLAFSPDERALFVADSGFSEDADGPRHIRRREVTEARRLVAAIMQGGGCDADEARPIARRLVDSNLVGHDSHGVLRVAASTSNGSSDGMAAAQHAADRSCSTATRIAIVDGNRGFGQVIGEFATRARHREGARRRASRWSACATAGTSGALGDWADMAAEAGQVSLHFLNTSGAQRVAPFGGSDRRLSTNPHRDRRAASPAPIR